MLQKAREQRVFISSGLQKQYGNDTAFTLNLGRLFTNVLRINLNAFVCDNYFLNLGDISLNDGVQDITIIPQVYLTEFTLCPYINDQLSAAGSTLVLSDVTNAQPVYKRDTLVIQGNQDFYFTGYTWFEKLGFTQALNGPSNLDSIQYASSPGDFSQSACILIRFGTPAQNAITNTVYANFHLNIQEQYGQRIQRYFFNYNSTQCVVYSKDEPFNELPITLLDEYGRQLRTPNNNQTGISVVMNLSVYDE